MSQDPTRAFLSHLHRGGQYAYWWTDTGKTSSWWETDKRPAPLPGGRRNVYFGIHPTTTIPTTNRHGEAREPAQVRSQIGIIAAVNCLFAEFDAKDYGDKANALTHIDSLAAAPSVVIDSGGGYHCYWLLRESWTLTTDDERAAAVDAQARWVEYVGSDAASKDLARVLRVPGTRNWKYDPAPAVKYVRCALHQVYALAELLALLPADAPDSETPRPIAGPTPTNKAPDWARQKLATAISMVVTAVDGEKHDQLLKAATLAGGACPHISPDEVERALYSAIVGRAKDAKGALDTIRDGIAWGAAHPLTPPADTPALQWRAGRAYCPECGSEARPSKYHDGLYCGEHKPAHNWRGRDAEAPKGTTITPPTVEYVTNWDDRVISADRLQRKAFTPLTWVVDRILPEGACVLAGKPKSKKSWFALAVGVAVATGGRLLGSLETTQGDVLYLDLESNQRRMQSRLRAMMERSTWPHTLHIATEWPRGDEGLAQLDMWMEAHPNTRLIVIDVLADFRRARDPKEDPYAYDRDTVKPINAWAERHRVCVVLVHHTRKAKADDVFDEISGSTGLPSAVATMWILGRNPEKLDESIFAMRGRDLIDDEPLALGWDEYTASHQLLGDAKDYAVTAERRAILDAMEDGKAYTPKDIAAAMVPPKSVAAIQYLLRQVLDAGAIEKVGYGKYARVAPQSPQSTQTPQSPQSTQTSRGNSEGTLRTLRGASGSPSEFAGRQKAVNANSEDSEGSLYEPTDEEIEADLARIEAYRAAKAARRGR